MYGLSSLKYLNAFFVTNFVFSKFQCGFRRKGSSTQQCLLIMLKSWNEAVDENKAFDTLMMDL